MDTLMWEELEKKHEVTYCSDCGVRIWKHWYKEEIRRKGGGWEYLYPEMTKCAKCFFKK